MEKENAAKKKEMPLLVKMVCMVLCVAIAWVVFSGNGFLPRAISFPVKEEKQQYSNMFRVTGYSFVADLINRNNPTVPVGTFHKMNIFNNNFLLDYQRTYYDDENDKYYVDCPNCLISFDAKRKKQKVLKKHLHQDCTAMVKYGNMLISLKSDSYQLTNIGGTRDEHLSFSNDNVVYTHKFEKYYDISTGRYGHKRIDSHNYVGMAELLKKNETEMITLDEFASLLTAVKSNLLAGWYPNENTAVFRHGDGEEQYVVHYNTETQSLEEFGPFPLSDNIKMYPYTMNCFVVWKKQEEKNIISVWNYVTGEMHTITETMPLETFAFRIKPSGNIAFIGHIATTASFWVYDGDSNFGDKFNSSEFKTTKPFYICIGKDSTLAENIDVYGGGYNWHFSHVDYMEEEK